MGGVFRREYIWWNIRADWKPARNVRGLLRTQAVGLPTPTPNTGRGGDYRKPKPQICHRSKLAQNAISIPTKRTFGERYQKSEWNAMWKETIGFSQSSSSDRLTDEQREDLIAENIYDWWISGKSYKKWYADKFLQLKFDFEE